MLARGSTLELVRPDEATGKLVSVLSNQTFSMIRSIMPFRLHGSTKDFVVIGSDSGKVTIVEYDPEKNRFEQVWAPCHPDRIVHLSCHPLLQVKCETFGKTGCRRVVPGQVMQCGWHG